MSASPTPENIPTPKAEDVLEYFREKNVEHRCPFCGTEQWMLFTNDPGVGAAQMVLQKNGDILRSHIRLLTMTCKNCTFVRQHLLNPFLEWLEKKRETADESHDK